MPHDSGEFDFFVSYARADNRDGWITAFVEELLAEHRKFSGGRELIPFFDKQDIRSFDDWQQRLHDGLAGSRLFLALLSPSYFASEWCRKEWKTWIDTEIAKHILSGGAAPIYFVEVPGLVGKVPGLSEQRMLGEHEVARNVAELCALADPSEEFLADSARVVKQIRDRRQITADFVLPFHQQGLAALRREDLRRVLAGLARDLDERSQRVKLAERSPSTVPPYNRNFSGRLEELLDLRQRLKDDRAGVICGVHGLGGIGKTELAFTYAHAFASAYPGGRFILHCDGKTSLRDAVLGTDSFTSLFRDRIGEQERMIPDTYFAAIAACLRQRIETDGHVLLVLDNVTDVSVVAPQQTDRLTALGPKLHLLATTRLRPPSGGMWLTLGELPESDALDVLEKHRPFERSERERRERMEPRPSGSGCLDVAPSLPDGRGSKESETERTAAIRIVKRLGGFALAIELVAAWLAAHPEVTYAGFLQRLGLEDLEALADAEADPGIELRRHNHERQVAAVLGPTLAALEPAERRALEYAALLPADVVALPWLRELAAGDFPELDAPPRPGRADPWSDLCRSLFRLALFSRAEGATADSRIVRVHRLVQDLVQREWDEETLARRRQALQTLVENRDAALEKTTRWQDARWELEPFDALARLWAETGHPRASWLLAQAGNRWHGLAEWPRAEPLMRRGLAIEETSRGLDHPFVAIQLNNLAQLLQATNRLAQAEPLMRRALAIDEQSYGAEHPNVARDLNNLAALLQATNRLAEAEPLMRRALDVFKASLGGAHPHTRTVADNYRRLLELMKK
jgi:tetratricopeptide (TPR) repeat protein